MRVIYLHYQVYNQICDILSNGYVTLFEHEEYLLNIIRRETKTRNFQLLDGNLVCDENNNYYKLILM
jgi:hypothetical protein